MNVDLKWSLWTTDMGVWEDYAPEVLEAIRQYIERPGPEGLVVHTGPRKEIRFGTVEFALADLRVDDHFIVGVEFITEWDSPEDLLDTLGLEDDQMEELCELLPWAGEGPGVRKIARKIFQAGTSFATVMEWIDQVEDHLLVEDQDAWRRVEKAFEKI